MQPDNHPKQKPASKVGIGLTGVAGGTLAVFLSGFCAEGSNLQRILIYLSPAISVAVTGLSSWAHKEVSRYLKDRELQRRAAMAKTAIRDALTDPETSAEHKDRCRKDLEQIERVTINDQLNRIYELTGNEDLKTPGERKDRHHRP